MEKYDFIFGTDREYCKQKELIIDQERECLRFELEISKEAILKCYLIVLDNNDNIRMQRVLGYGPKIIQIGKNGLNTTAGGVPGSISPGTWKIIICSFAEYIKHCGKNQFRIDLKVLFEADDMISQPVGEEVWNDNIELLYEKKYCNEKRWYKGDFHTHTQLSDGKETVDGVMKKAEMMKMDFYVPTEHNVVHTGWIDSDILILPGMEITTEHGHCNVFGLRDIPNDILGLIKNAGKPQVWNYILDAFCNAKKRNQIVSINHPFLHVWKWKYYDMKLSMLSHIEIINDPTYEYAAEANDKAISFIDFLWNEGIVVYGLGGSDSHNLIEERYSGATEPSIAGDPATFVYCEGLSNNNLLTAVRKGHVIVTRYIKMKVIYCIGEKKYLPGDCLDEVISLKNKIVAIIQISVPDNTINPKLYIIENKQKREIKILQTGNKYNAQVEISLEKDIWKWSRFEVRGDNNKFLAYSNPVYIGNRVSKLKSFGDAVKKWEKEID